MDPVYICDMTQGDKATVKSELHLHVGSLHNLIVKKKKVTVPGSAMKASDCLAISAFL
jgi:hypothetical protein